jgi:hypothetical protein
MKPATPPRRILQSTRLDREANFARDHGAVAAALHYDMGLPADAALARAQETFRPGETVRKWWDRARAAPMNDAGGLTKGTGTVPRLQYLDPRQPAPVAGYYRAHDAHRSPIEQVAAMREGELLPPLPAGFT